MKNGMLAHLAGISFRKIRLHRLLLFFIFLIGLVYSIPAQAEDVLDKKITLVVKQKPVRDVLNDISGLVEIKFVYSSQKIPARKKVSILATDQKVRDVLNLLLEPLDVLYYVSGNQVVLIKKHEINDVVGKLQGLAENNKQIPVNFFYKVISGKVNNEKGEPLQGVSVVVKGTTRGTTTNAAGNFTIDAEAGETLDFSMVGYKTFSIKVGQENTITVQLESEVANISEVVVTGYGTQKRTNVTGAVSSVNSKTINELPVASISHALQGRIAGL